MILLPAAPGVNYDPATLPVDREQLRVAATELLHALQQRDRLIATLQTRLDLQLRRLYGPSSERSHDSAQASLFSDDTATTNNPGDDDEDDDNDDTPKKRKKKKHAPHGRAALPSHLPRQRHVYDLPEGDRLCPCCGRPRQVIGEECSEQLDYVPASMLVRVWVRIKYACHDCPEQPVQVGHRLCEPTSLPATTPDTPPTVTPPAASTADTRPGNSDPTAVVPEPATPAPESRPQSTTLLVQADALVSSNTTPALSNGEASLGTTQVDPATSWPEDTTARLPLSVDATPIAPSEIMTSTEVVARSAPVLTTPRDSDTDVVPPRTVLTDMPRSTIACTTVLTAASLFLFGPTLPSLPAQGRRWSHFVTAPRPAQLLPRCLAAPGLLAHVIVSKFVDHLPLYRQERILRRHGVHVSRSTLCDWLQHAADGLRPLYTLLKAEVLRSYVVQNDDTPMKVLDGSRDDTRTCRLWASRGDARHPYTVFNYSPDRRGVHPQQFFRDFAGYLQGDAYTGYDALFRSEKIREVGCWAHVRRKVFEAEGTDPVRASYLLGQIRRLYKIERRAKKRARKAKLSPEAFWEFRDRLRREQALPIVEELKKWLDRERALLLPQSPMAAAFTYALNQWAALVRYVSDGRLEIDNNSVEQELRALKVGLHNYLFFGSDIGGETAAVLYSVVASCRRHGVEPWHYVRDVLERLPSMPPGELGVLLPNRWAASRRAAAQSSVDG